MSQDRPEQDREVAVQREVVRIALAGVAGFALAGSGAIREHGMIERPTEDVDLFTTNQDVTAFSAAVDQVTDQLRGSGYQVDQSRRAAQFARLHVATKDRLQLIIARERSGGPAGADFLPKLQQELLQVIAKYVKVDPDSVKVEMDHREHLDLLAINIALPDQADSAR